MHFIYEWTNESLLVAPFSGINESTWEHMKLLFVPMFVFSMVQRLFCDSCENFWCVKLVGSLSGLILIPTLFYTYNGAIGKSPDWLNITIFFISAAAAIGLETRLFEKGKMRCKLSWLPFFALFMIGVLFFVFTFFPPRLPIFRDPLNGTFGMPL